MYKPFVICNKRAGGTAIIDREEFKYYSPARRFSEFTQVVILGSPRDEQQALKKFPRLKRVIEIAYSMGLGGGELTLDFFRQLHHGY